MKANEFLTEAKAVKQRLDAKCWTGKHKEGTKIKGGVRVNNCVPNESVEQGLAEAPIEMDPAEPMNPMIHNHQGANPAKLQYRMARAAAQFKELAKRAENGSAIGWESIARQFGELAMNVEQIKHGLDELAAIRKKGGRGSRGIDPNIGEQGVAEGGSPAQQAAIAINMKKNHKKPKNESLELAEEFDMIENIIEQIADQHAVDVELVWEDLSMLTDDELYVFAVTSEMVNEDWQKANKRDKTDGMSKKAVNAYRREHPGSKLKTAVTTKPSKLKKGSKASKRRSSYCSRSRGQMKMHNISCSKTPDKAICKARRRWNC
jgi:hypothetical protein